jgi:hypothetical protein
VLRRYDFITARRFLDKIGKQHTGIHVVSTLQPLSLRETVPSLEIATRRSDPPRDQSYLFQDLSAVPPRVIDAWVRQFMIQATRERFASPTLLESFALNLRTRVAIMADLTPDAQAALSIFWSPN